VTDAESYGIDLDELRGERFSHPAHYSMLREHLDRVRAWEIRQLASEYELAAERRIAEAKAAAIADEMMRVRAKREAVRARVEKAKATRRARAEYEFTDRQLEIARKSLGLA
jgi:hypothetical protein